MSLTVAEIADLLAEWPDRWKGARCASAGHAGGRRFVVAFDLPAPGASFAVVIDLTPGRPLLFVVQPAPDAAPSPLGEFLRGKSLDGWEAVTGDRIARLRLDPFVLVVELIPASPRLILLEGDRIAWIDAELIGKIRKLAVGGSYQAPQMTGSGSPSTRFARSGSTCPQGTDNMRACGEAAATTREMPLNTAIAEKAVLTDRRDRWDGLNRALRGAIAKAERGLSELAKGESGAAEAELWKVRGELIKGALGKIRTGLTKIALTNWFDPAGGEITIPLDPAKSARENMEDCFKRARKWTAGAPARARRRRELEARREAAAGLLARVESMEPDADPAELEAEARALGALPAPKSRPEAAAKARAARKKEPFRKFTSADGFDILVGKSARENDALTFRVARGNDLWLHADGVGGSHVVVRLPAGKPVPPETLLDAAALAVHFSQARGRGRAQVVWTHVKHLRRIPGAGAGKVALTEQKFVTVDNDRERIQGLLRPEEGKI